MDSERDPIDKAISELGWRNKINCVDRVVQIACLIRKDDRRPLKAEWWSGKEVSVIGVALNGDFFLRHCDGSVRLWDHRSQMDSIVAPGVREFVAKIEG